MLLTIGIRGLCTRTETVKNLLASLSDQIHNCPFPVELIYFSDIGAPKASCGMGLKGNRIADIASGKYISFVDDDDLVADNYVLKICTELANSDVDCIGITGIITSPSGKEAKFIHSIVNDIWEEKDGVFLRSPSQINPIRTSIARQKFSSDAYNSDHEYAVAVKSLIKTEKFIEDPLYFYRPNYEF